MSDPLILAIDQGTSSSRAILFTKDGVPVAVRQKELQLHFPHKGWVEQRPEDIWNDVLDVTRGVLADGAGRGGISSPSASPISAKRLFCGTVKPENRFITPSSGRIAERRIVARH
jgi:glycerol kinase